MNRALGLHIRLEKSIVAVIEKALLLQLPLFQTFAVTEKGATVHPSYEELAAFLELRRKHFGNLFLHGSYWINLCRKNRRSFKTLLKEVAFARRLEFTHFIVHPGAAEPRTCKQKGIDILADNINRLLATTEDISIVLENTTHGKLSIGSDITDFAAVLQLVEQPQRVLFCFDTSHAHAYGYDIISATGQQNFIQLLQQAVPRDQLCLVHLNDTLENRGAKIDQHAIPGEGKIGTASLTSLLSNPYFKDVPAIMELPKITLAAEQEILDATAKWLP